MLKVTSSTWMLCLLSSTNVLLSPKVCTQLPKGPSLVFIPTRSPPENFSIIHYSTDFQSSLTGPLDFDPKFLSTISNFLGGMVKTHQPNILKPNPFSFQANVPLPNSACLWHCPSHQTRTQKVVLCWESLFNSPPSRGEHSESQISDMPSLSNTATFVTCLLHWGSFPSPPGPGPLL